MSEDTVLVALDIVVREAADAKPEQTSAEFLRTRLTETQMGSRVARAFLRQSETKNVSAKQLVINFDFDNISLDSLPAESRDGTTRRILFSLFFEAPTLLTSADKEGMKGLFQCISFYFGERHAFISGIGMCGAEFTLTSPSANRDGRSMQGVLLSADDANNLHLYASPCRLDFVISTPEGIGDNTPRTVKGSFLFETGLMLAAPGTRVYPFDRYVFGAKFKFPYRDTLVRPTFTSDIGGNEGLCLISKIAGSTTVSDQETWDLDLVLVRKQKRTQFLLAVLVLLSGLGVYFVPVPSWRTILYGVAVCIFILMTSPAVPGVPSLYPMRVLALLLGINTAGLMEYFR